MVTRPNRIGEVVRSRYQLLSVIDKGGQGTVYRARDFVRGHEVAIKVLNDAIAMEADWRERMLREAHALDSLTGTAAVRILDQQWTEDGALCLVMELLRGLDLDDYLRQLEQNGERLPLPSLFRLLAPIVETLEIANDRGILHRDLKPANIFVLEPLGADGVKLLDFGFAKFLGLKSVTAAGFIAGSPSYIAPESFRGDPARLDRRIDVYSLGAVIFRALAGKPPFAAEDLRDLLRLVTRAERPSLHAIRPDLPPAIDDWVKQALAIEPDDRFFRVTALWNALQEALHERAPNSTARHLR